MKITYRPIGIIHSPFKEPKGTPIQPKAAKGIDGMVEVFPQYEKGLKDIEGFSHIILIYHFHLSKACSLEVKPYMDSKLHGLFATRAPARPNVDGTPLLDIKPFVPEFNSEDIIKKGWLEKNIRKLPKSKDDGRFVK